MFKLALKWGGIVGGILTALMLASYIVYPDFDVDHMETSETFGYASIIGCLALIYLAIADLEKQQAGATLWQKIMLGCAVSAVAGVMFGLYNVFYTSVLNPEFMDLYFDHYISQLDMEPGPARDEAVAALQAEKEMFKSPLTQFFAMGATVLMAGIPISVLLAFLQGKLGQKTA